MVEQTIVVAPTITNTITHVSHTTVTTTGGNLKLRGLLQQSRSLLRKRQLKKALNNAQIAKDFALRSGEAPEVAAAAQLLMAEIYILNASYTCNEEQRTQGWRLIEQLETNSVKGSDGLDPLELKFTKALCKRRLDDFASAKTGFEELIAALPPDAKMVPFAWVALASTLVQLNDVATSEVLAKADEKLAAADKETQHELYAELTFCHAKYCEQQQELTAALNYAHDATQWSKRSENHEIHMTATTLLGKLSRLNRNYPIALRMCYEAMDLAEQMDCKPVVIETHLEIGHVFQALNNDREAEKYFKFVAEESKTIGRIESAFHADLALGKSAQRSKNTELANTYLSSALQAAQSLDWIYQQGIVLSEIASVKFEHGEGELARHFVTAALKRFSDEAGFAPSAMTYYVQSRIAFTDEAYQDAISFADLASNAATLEGRSELFVGALSIISKSQEALGNVELALHAQQQATETALHLLSEQRVRQLPDLDMRAALRKKEREIEKLTRENSLKSALIDKNEEIERANRDLMQANEELRQFAYVASHDLKEPLRQIGSYVSLIKRKYAHLFDADGEEYFGFISEGVTRLNRLLDSLMHYAAVARQDNEVSNVDLNRLMQTIESEIESNIRDAGATITYESLPVVQTGGKLLRHVMKALVENSLKFKQRNVDCQISVRCLEEGDFHKIEVKDNGIGINPEYQDKVFGLFQMLHAKTEYVGTGVGLAIAQKTVQRLGGRIWFEANADRSAGTTFFFTLPKEADRLANGNDTLLPKAA